MNTQASHISQLLDRPAVLSLDDPECTSVGLGGSKAANLATLRQAGLPVLPGFVLTTAGASLLFRGDRDANTPVRSQLEKFWTALSGNGRHPVAVRSSSTIEDTSVSSMAGQYTTVLDVGGWPDFIDAVFAVLDSADEVGVADAPMAVLVQPFVRALCGGVIFGADPLTGRDDTLLVSVADDPEQLVSGVVEGASIMLSRRGRLTHRGDGQRVAALTGRVRRQLARLAAQTAAAFGGPQDMEWLLDDRGVVHLLQSRPITAAASPPVGPLYGPGPVAETFPAPLHRLEEDLWVAPLRAAVSEVLVMTGAAPRIRASDPAVVRTIDGRVAVDLELFGVVTPRRRWLARLDPRPPLRRLRAAWQVGRIRGALPALARDLVMHVDDELGDIPGLGVLDDTELLAVLRGAAETLQSLHTYEMLAGLLMPSNPSAATTAASIAIETLVQARAEGLDDDEIVARHPNVLALTAPAIGPGPSLPPTSRHLPDVDHEVDPDVIAREALRLRIRWVHELTARVAWELGARLAPVAIAEQGLVRALSAGELERAVRSRRVPRDLAPEQLELSTPPLPAVFRFTRDGGIAAEPTGDDTSGVGVSSGRGMGRVAGSGTPNPGEVMVVSALEPHLAPILPRLAGLVAETGNALSHLAILAREYRVPTVVGYRDALTSFPAGTSVIVDGDAGVVEIVGDGAGELIEAQDVTTTARFAPPDTSDATDQLSRTDTSQPAGHAGGITASSRSSVGNGSAAARQRVRPQTEEPM